ncbi:zinc finger CCCH domain-containing protein [Carpediemonas membranifera]|uniref:Zinc finger CCCH domain-containing protein n=1 Tax=Carpediemonas membranifera TaxID=201153 RepID=A0A8J6B116_9EUKA|nr:zinc finger CCCH domain-containing protein [Carpediemonas membranifera]|eukprot:KAG9391984.1 zinc finger CCCH domain-containing protein [Carpediemonas membranifera]
MDVSRTDDSIQQQSIQTLRSPRRIEKNQNQRGPIETREICRDFLRGVCTRKSCKYWHPTEEELKKRFPQSAAHYMRRVPGDRTDSVPICVDFLKSGRCARAGCPYRHWWDPRLLEGVTLPPPPPPHRNLDMSDESMDKMYLIEQLQTAHKAHEELMRQNTILRTQNATLAAQLRQSDQNLAQYHSAHAISMPHLSMRTLSEDVDPHPMLSNRMPVNNQSWFGDTPQPTPREMGLFGLADHGMGLELGMDSMEGLNQYVF